jgi:hypothetical protein
LISFPFSRPLLRTWLIISRLLRARSERPHRRDAEQRHELALFPLMEMHASPNEP